MIYFDSDMSKSTNMVVYMYFNWKNDSDNIIVKYSLYSHTTGARSYTII